MPPPKFCSNFFRNVVFSPMPVLWAIIRHARYSGFAFCDFQTKSMADECVRSMDGLKIENLAISVEIARR